MSFYRLRNRKDSADAERSLSAPQPGTPGEPSPPGIQTYATGTTDRPSSDEAAELTANLPPLPSVPGAPRLAMTEPHLSTYNTPSLGSLMRRGDMASLVGTNENAGEKYGLGKAKGARPRTKENRESSEGTSLPSVLDLTQAVLALTERLNDTIKSKETLKITYSGRPDEDPLRFADEFEYFCNKQNIDNDYDRARLFADQCRGEAKIFINSLPLHVITFEELRNRFIYRYNNSDALVSLTGSLFSEAQKETEAAEQFTDRKRALFYRIYPRGRESELVPIILTLLRPALRSRLRGLRLINLEELTRLATEIERDIAAERASYRVAPQNRAQPPPALRQQQPQQRQALPPPRVPQINTSRQPGPNATSNRSIECFICGANHYARDCPRKNQQEPRGKILAITNGEDEATPGPSQTTENCQRGRRTDS